MGKVMTDSKYGVFVNHAAGDYYISELDWNDPRQDGYYNCWAEFDSMEEVDAFIEKQIADTTVFAVFWDNVEESGFTSEEHCFSGNYRGASTYITEFQTEEEAEKYLEILYGGGEENFQPETDAEKIKRKVAAIHFGIYHKDRGLVQNQNTQSVFEYDDEEIVVMFEDEREAYILNEWAQSSAPSKATTDYYPSGREYVYEHSRKTVFVHVN